VLLSDNQRLWEQIIILTSLRRHDSVVQVKKIIYIMEPIIILTSLRRHDSVVQAKKRYHIRTTIFNILLNQK